MPRRIVKGARAVVRGVRSYRQKRSEANKQASKKVSANPSGSRAYDAQRVGRKIGQKLKASGTTRRGEIGRHYRKLSSRQGSW